jgi:hypothetical protein
MWSGRHGPAATVKAQCAPIALVRWHAICSWFDLKVHHAESAVSIFVRLQRAWIKTKTTKTTKTTFVFASYCNHHMQPSAGMKQSRNLLRGGSLSLAMGTGFISFSDRSTSELDPSIQRAASVLSPCPGPSQHERTLFGIDTNAMLMFLHPDQPWSYFAACSIYFSSRCIS